MPEQSLKNMTREEYHHFRRTRKSQPWDHPLQRLWDPPKLTIVYHWWENGRRIKPQLEPGHHNLRLLEVRVLAWNKLLYDCELCVRFGDSLECVYVGKS